MNTYGTEISSVFVGTMHDKEWSHFAWQVTLTREDKTRVIPYKMGLGHEQTKCGQRIAGSHYRTLPCHHVRCHNAGPQPTPPTLYDVLTSLKADATHGETFEDWCANFGESTDSRKAMDTYLACQQSEVESRKFFGADWPKIIEDEEYN